MRMFDSDLLLEDQGGTFNEALGQVAETARGVIHHTEGIVGGLFEGELRQQGTGIQFTDLIVVDAVNGREKSADGRVISEE